MSKSGDVDRLELKYCWRIYNVEVSNAGKYDTGLCIAYLQEDIRIQNRYKDALQHVMATDVGWQMFLMCFSCSTGPVACINCLPLALETQGTTAAGDRTDGNRSSAQSGG